MALEMRQVDPDEEASRTRRNKPEKDEEEDDNDMALAEPERALSSEALEMATKPVVVLREMVTRGQSDLARAEQILSDALASYKRSTSRSAFGTDAAHTASFAEMFPKLDKSANQATEIANGVFAQSRLIQEATSVDREPRLSETDLQRANNLRAFVAEDASLLPLSELRVKIARAIGDNDTPACWLYLRYGQARLKENRQEDKPGSPLRQEVNALLRSIGDRLMDRRGREVNQQATDLRKKALETNRRIRSRMEEAMKAGGHLAEPIHPRYF